jgi:glucose/arabinose dehydrogenase
VIHKITAAPSDRVQYLPMKRALRCVLIVAAVMACSAQPTPTVQPPPHSTPPLGCDGVPIATSPNGEVPTPGCTATPPLVTPSARATPTDTPTATAAQGLSFKLFGEGYGGAVTFVTPAGDGTNTLYLVRQDGQILILNADGTALAQPFLDINDRISSGGERGLLGLAFHPDYKDNGRFYVDYTDVNGNTVVGEYLRTTASTADPTSERVIFTVQQPFPNHNGGMLAFGPDGMLYVGIGDGGSGGDPNGNGQSDKTLLGKIVRVDVDAAGSAAAPQIWDKGMRNPWRFAFDRKTGDLWIGDVGQGAHEEIDAEAKGTGGFNYGWNIMEGPACFLTPTCDKTGLTLPVANYGHSGGNCGVIGGYVYRGSASPGLVGTYLYADLCSGNIYGLDAAAAMAGGAPKAVPLGSVGAELSSFGQDEMGELYIVEHSGRLISLTYSGANPPR